MRFANPVMLWTLAFLPVLAALVWRSSSRRRRLAGRMGSPDVIDRLYPESILRWRGRRSRAGLAVFALLAVAAARPQYGRIEQEVRRAGVDVIIALDTSRSMLTRDVEPNRLEKAKTSLKWLLRRLKGNRVGIVAFAGEAFLNCPMTHDLGLADLVLESLDHDSIPVAGTDLGKVIRVSQAAFDRGGRGRPVLVLITDGEDNEQQGLAAAREAAEFGMIIYAIGIGSERGEPIPDGAGGFKKGPDGAVVTSRLDMPALTAIASATGGVAVEAGANLASVVNTVSARIERLEKTEAESRKIVIHQDRFTWFVAPAMLLLAWLLVTKPRQEGARSEYVAGTAAGESPDARTA